MLTSLNAQMAPTTADIPMIWKKRIETHNRGRGAKYTKPRLPVVLVYYEEFETKEEAMSREWHLKQLSHAQKRALIK